MIELVVDTAYGKPGLLGFFLAIGTYYVLRYFIQNREPQFNAPKLYEEKGNKDLVKLHSIVKTEFQKVSKGVSVTLRLIR